MLFLIFYELIKRGKTGIWIEYFCNGNMKNKLTFTNGRPDGYAQMFHENGKISEEGNWKNNRWVGNYKLYYDNGQVQHEFVFNPSGKREGAQKYYYDNGQIAIEGNFSNGKEAGLIKEYHENGDIKVGVDAFEVIWRHSPNERWKSRLIALPIVKTIAVATYNIFAKLLYRWNVKKGHWKIT